MSLGKLVAKVTAHWILALGSWVYLIGLLNICLWTSTLVTALKGPVGMESTLWWLRGGLAEIAQVTKIPFDFNFMAQRQYLLSFKLQYFGHLMQRVDSLEKTDAGRD